MSPHIPRRLLLAALGACLFVTVAGCGPKARSRTARVPVTVARAESRAVPFALTSTGTVEAIESADVGAQVGGTVVRVAYREGQEVRRGAVLIELDARPFRTALDRALATLARDRAQALTAQAEAERAERLFSQGVLSQAERDQKRATAEALAATVRADSAAVGAARLDLEFATIRAPISGRTGRQMVNTGDLVRAGSGEALVTINQTMPVRVAFPVPVNDVALVQRYRNAAPRVTARLPGADSTGFEGRLVFVDNAVDPQSGTLLLKGEFPNRDSRLVPGQFVDVRLVLYEDARATVVPAPAVTNGQQGTYVYVMNPDSTVATRPVSVARTVDELAVVTAGLEPGEMVVTEGQLRLSPGAKVIVREPSRGAQ
jgi:multidrug efflux system membrane fusion protein